MKIRSEPVKSASRTHASTVNWPLAVVARAGTPQLTVPPAAGEKRIAVESPIAPGTTVNAPPPPLSVLVDAPGLAASAAVPVGTASSSRR